MGFASLRTILVDPWLSAEENITLKQSKLGIAALVIAFIVLSCVCLIASSLLLEPHTYRHHVGAIGLIGLIWLCLWLLIAVSVVAMLMAVYSLSIEQRQHHCGVIATSILVFDFLASIYLMIVLYSI